MNDRRSILLLCRTTKAEAGNVADHIRALSTRSRHDVRTFNPVDRPDAARLLDLDEFDAVVIHYTIPVVVERYLPAVLRDKLASYGGLKVQFIQDEYRWIDAVTATMRELGIGLLFTCVPEAEVPKVYGSVPGLETVTTLPGYVPDELVGRATPPLAERPLDVGYRGRTVPYWLGRLGWEKAAIGLEFRERCEALRLRCDIAIDESERIYGDAWYRFLASCRATLGTESGASIADFDGSVERAVKAYLARHPGASFDEVERELLAPYEGNVVINTISSRMFEAAALRTAMVLFPGEYSRAIEPWEHYLPLAKDFSNLEEIVDRLRHRSLADLVERAHARLVASGEFSLQRFVRRFDAEVTARSSRGAPARKPALERAARRRRLPPAAMPARLRFVVGKAVQPLAMIALVLGDREIRRLAFSFARDRNTSLRVAAGDLWRLAALRRGVRDGLFTVEPAAEEAGHVVVLTSRPGRVAGVGVVASVELPATVVWDHSPVGETVPLVGAGLLVSEVGSPGSPGAHTFRALGAASQRHRAAVAAALAPLLGRAPEAADGSDRPPTI